MPLFQYSARSSDGSVVTGTAEATDQATLVRSLREKGLTTTAVTTASSKSKAKNAKKGKRGRIKLDDLVILSQQMSVMIRAGLPLIEVLNILGEQTERVALADVMKKVERDVESGASLTEAMEKYPRVFNTFFISMVRAGEASGMLDTILDQVATYMERIASLQRKIKSAIMYPATVTVVATLITIFLLVKVVPVFKDIFSGLGGELPWPTLITVTASETIRDYWYLVLGGLIVFVFIMRQWGKTRNGRYRIDKFYLTMPVFGPLVLKSSVAKFCRTLGTLIRSGVNILYALEITAQSANNAVIERAAYKTRASMQAGESLTKPLEESGVFPPMVYNMVEVGEETGQLAERLGQVADVYDDEVDASVAGVTSIIEPILIISLAGFVLTIAISLFLPFVRLMQAIAQ